MTTTWNGLELRHLVALAAIADAGTISRAADELGFTQSAVSQQVAGLERVIGTPVFDRPGGPRPLVLTEAGQVLLSHARTVLAQLRLAEADVRAVVAGERGTLRVGTVQSVGTRVLPDVLRRFAVERPGVSVVLRESHDDTDLLALVAAGELDVTFCESSKLDEPWTCEQVLVDPFVLLAPASSPESAHPSVSVTEVAALPLIGYRNGACHSSQRACFPDGVVPDFVFQSDDNTTIQGCVGAGLGYALVPRLTIDAGDPAVRIVAIEPPPPPRLIGVAWSSERREPPSLAAFLACVHATCDALAVDAVAA
jgi:DNA-binding transcriptional LysR family regulator